MSASNRYDLRSRPSGLTRITCTDGEALGWSWSYATRREAFRAVVRMTSAEMTTPDQWMSATAPDGKHVASLQALEEDDEEELCGQMEAQAR